VGSLVAGLLLALHVGNPARARIPLFPLKGNHQVFLLVALDFFVAVTAEFNLGHSAPQRVVVFLVPALSKKRFRLRSRWVNTRAIEVTGEILKQEAKNLTASSILPRWIGRRSPANLVLSGHWTPGRQFASWEIADWGLRPFSRRRSG
jgi:hypothetical protein